MDDPGEGEDYDDDTYGAFLEEQRLTFRHQSPDPLLQLLVSFVNQNMLQFTVTLFMGGTMVSGRLISSVEYLQRVADELEARAVGDPQILTTVNRQIAVAHQVSEVFDEASADEVTCIHLDQVTMRIGELPVSTGLWRGRIASVDAWVYGVGEDA